MFDCETFGIKNIDREFCVANKLSKGKYSSCFTCDKSSGVDKMPTKQQTVPRNNKGKKNRKGNNLYASHRVVDISTVRDDTDIDLHGDEERILKRLKLTGEDRTIANSL